MVLVSVGLLVVLTVVENHFNPTKGELYKQLWALGVVGLGLSVLADFVPQIAGPFAILVAVAMVARRPGVLGTFISQGTAASKQTAKGTPGIDPNNKRYAPGNPASARPG